MNQDGLAEISLVHHISVSTRNRNKPAVANHASPVGIGTFTNVENSARHCYNSWRDIMKGMPLGCSILTIADRDSLMSMRFMSDHPVQVHSFLFFQFPRFFCNSKYK